MPVNEITSLEDFNKIINSEKPVLIDFWAEWCGPCKAISPVLEKLSESEDSSDIEFYKVDVDKQGDISEEVGIRAMPTFLLFNKGEKVGELVGAVQEKLVALVTQAKTLTIPDAIRGDQVGQSEVE